MFRKIPKIKRREFLEKSILAGLGASGLALSGCTTTSPPTTTATTGTGVTATTSVTPVSGGTLTVSMIQDPESLNPAFMRTGGPYIGILIFDPWVIIDSWSSDTPTVVSNLATSIEPSNNYKRWTMEIDPSAKWSDGTPITSQDMKFTIDTRTDTSVIQGLGWTTAQTTLYFRWKGQWKINSVNIVDDQTIDVNAETSIFDFDFQMAGVHASCIPKAAITANPLGFGTNPSVSSGPFKFREMVTAQHVKVERNPGWWLGTPYLDGVTVKIIPEETTSLNQLEAGELDVLPNLSSTNYDRVKNNPSLRTKLNPDYYLYLWGFNVSKWPGSNIDFRKAVFYACDWPSFATGLLPADVATPFYGYLVNTWAYDSNIVNTWPYKYDMTKAQQQINAAKAVQDIGTVTIIANNVGTVGTEGEYIATQLRSLGVTVDLQVLDRPSYQNKVQTTNDWNITYVEPHGASTDPQARTTEIMGPTKFIDNHWLDTDVAHWLLMATYTTDKAERTDYYQQCEHRCIEAAVYMPTYLRRPSAGYRAVVHDPRFSGGQMFVLGASRQNNVWKG